MNDLHEPSSQERMIRQQIIDRGISDERILSAIRSIPRERFLPASERENAYADRPAPIGHGQTISQPYIVALMTLKLDIEPSSRVLEIGTGSGYQTAVLSRLATEVFTIERVKPLLDVAWDRLMTLNYRNINFRHGDGAMGWPAATPFDRILIAAAAKEIPRALLLSQLKDGGQAVLPVGDDSGQMLLHIRKSGEALGVTELCPCRFVDLVTDKTN